MTPEAEAAQKRYLEVEDIGKVCYEIGLFHQMGHPALVEEQDNNGHMHIVAQAIEWAEEFSKQNCGVDWDSTDWYLEMDAFIESKLNELADDLGIDMTDYHGTVDGYLAACSKRKDSQLEFEMGRIHSCQ